MKTLGYVIASIGAAFLCTRYLCAAIIVSNLSTQSNELYKVGLSCVGNPILFIGVTFLVVVLVLSVVEIVQDKFHKHD